VSSSTATALCTITATKPRILQTPICTEDVDTQVSIKASSSHQAHSKVPTLLAWYIGPLAFDSVNLFWSRHWFLLRFVGLFANNLLQCPEPPCIKASNSMNRTLHLATIVHIHHCIYTRSWLAAYCILQSAGQLVGLTKAVFFALSKHIRLQAAGPKLHFFQLDHKFICGTTALFILQQFTIESSRRLDRHCNLDLSVQGPIPHRVLFDTNRNHVERPPVRSSPQGSLLRHPR
jgi:hypothetical protein